MKLRISRDFDQNKYTIIAMYLNITLITRFVASAYSIVTRSSFSKYTGIFQWAILLIPLIYFFLNVLSDGIKIRQLAIFIVWGLLMAYTYFVTQPRDFLMRQTIVEGLSHIIIPSIMIQEVTEPDKMMEALEKYIGICTITCLMQLFSPVLMRNAYYSFSYLSFIPCAICFAYVLKGKVSKYFIPLIIILVANFIFGGRGFFLCIAIFIFIYSFMYFKTDKNAMVFASFFLLFTLLISLFGNRLASVITGFGISSRTLSFLTGELSDNSRLRVWEALLSEFFKNPLKIRGLLSDREYIATVFHHYTEIAIAGWYSHNFVVEILFEFGIVGIGVLLLLTKRFIFILRSFKDINDDNGLILFIIVSSLFLGKMSISSSYLIDLSTGIFIGFLLALKKIVLRNKVSHRANSTTMGESSI